MREIDEIGSPCPSADHAILEASRAALEISLEHLRAGKLPREHRFEVCDTAGRLVFELPFSDLLSAHMARPTADHGAIQSRLADTLQRSRELQAEVAVAMTTVQTTLATTRALLRS